MIPVAFKKLKLVLITNKFPTIDEKTAFPLIYVYQRQLYLIHQVSMCHGGE